LTLKVRLEHGVILTGQGLDSDGALLAKVIGCSFREWPLNESLSGDNLFGAGLVDVAGLSNDWV